jgi:2-polyprenyl-6-hydroxyphenyl methylase/3-demethylubiquinone-9 3-methyltransferase
MPPTHTKPSTIRPHRPDDARFGFGANWLRFLETIDESRVAAAMASLCRQLRVDSLRGLRFLDVGCGSGLFSLAAHRLGASVHSFDLDPQSVACTGELKQRFAPAAADWTIESGSALDDTYLSQLARADVVYAWGVLHHTGEMWRGIDRVADRVSPGGRLWLALYNDQGSITPRWVAVKRLYQRLPPVLGTLLCLVVAGVLFAHRLCGTVTTSLVLMLTGHSPLTPFRTLTQRLVAPDPRGMSRWHDLVDWVGGWPFEVARPEEVVNFLQERGFVLEGLKTVGGKLGCNEYLFRREEVAAAGDT